MNKKMTGSSVLARLLVMKNHCSKVPERAKAKILNKVNAEAILKRATHTQSNIKLSKSRARVDEKICITVNGLKSREKVTLQTFVFNDVKSFGACGHYIADEEGNVNTYKQESYGGTFEGLEPMGLFWSMRSCPGIRPRRILPRDITKPFDVKIDVHPGFVEFDRLPWTETFHSLASSHFYQEFLPQGVKCIPINEDGVRGVLCLPPGEAPFPAVVDIFGMTPHTYVHRSALLAANGIASFVVSYVGEGLATSWADIQYSYFLKSFDWLSGHPSVNNKAMGVLASCIGGAYGALIPWKRPDIKCLVTINAAGYPLGPTQTLEGELIEILESDRVFLESRDGAISFRHPCEEDKPVIPYWRHGVKALHIEGQDDCCIFPGNLKRQHDSRVPEQFMKNIEFVSYPGAGHIIEPPYMPLCSSSFNALFKLTIPFGGQPKQHASAQEDSWKRVVSFFKKHLTAS